MAEKYDDIMTLNHINDHLAQMSRELEEESKKVKETADRYLNQVFEEEKKFSFYGYGR